MFFQDKRKIQSPSCPMAYIVCTMFFFSHHVVTALSSSVKWTLKTMGSYLMIEEIKQTDVKLHEHDKPQH